MDMILAALLGLGAGFISALSTGGGLLAIPGLILLGLSPVTAIATSRFGAASSGASASIRYQRDHQIAWPYMPLFAILAVAAGIFGPRLLIGLDQATVEKTVAYLMLAMLPLLLFKHNVGVVDQKRSLPVKAIGILLLFLVLLYATAFGGGSGILFAYVLVYMFGLRVIEANATFSVMSLISSSVALVTYIGTGNVLLHIAIPLTIGSLVGGYFGANMALTQGSAWVKWVLAAVVIVSSIKLLS